MIFKDEKVINRLFPCLFLFFTASSFANYMPNEYNVWRTGHGFIYGATQTEKDEPVLITITGPGTQWAGVVISVVSESACEGKAAAASLLFNSTPHPVSYSCIPMGQGSITTYILSDTQRANRFYTDLKSGFTVVLDNRIKVWATNIATPKN